MPESIEFLKQSTPLRRNILIIFAAWTVAIFSVLGWHLWEIQKNTLELVLIEATHTFEQDLTYRRWSTGHGGVYVPVTEKMLPNPYLAHLQNRDVTTISGLKLTLVNPAYMTRQVHELGKEQYGHQGHITSLNPIRPANAPDAWEAAALRVLERGVAEVIEISKIGDTDFLRLMRPMFTETGCLKCHAQQGYQVGDLRGGISVSIPMAPRRLLMSSHMRTVTVGYALIWLLGLCGIGFGAARNNSRIQERERAEKALRKSEKLLAETGKLAKIGGWEVDSETLEMIWTEEIYRIFESPLNYKPIIEETINIIHPDDRSEFEAAMQNALKHGEFYDQEVRFITDKGKHLWARIICNPVTVAGKTIRLTGTFQDVTELKMAGKKRQELEARLLQSDKMASVGQLAAGVAHEINNPMGFIAGNLRSLQKYADKFSIYIDAQKAFIEAGSKPQDAENLKTLEKKIKLEFLLEDTKDLIDESLDGASRVQAIVRNLKTFARVDQDGVQTIDLNECIDSTLNIIWNELKYKTEIEKDYADLPAISCHPQQLSQIFLNLLINASHAIETQGIIKIRSWSDEDHVYVAVSDDGCGISEDDLRQIFVPFFTTKEVGKGTGLGLSMVYDMVKGHDGDISVESELGKGTTFTVKLPIRLQQ